MDDLNVLNIPAFQRKRSISAHEKKTASYTRQRPTKKLRTTRTRRSVSQIEERSISNPFRSSLPSEDLFPSPLIDDVEIIETPSIQRSSFREMQICGRCEGFFDKIDVAVIQLTSSIRNGDSIIFETDNGLFEQEISSMQINRQDISVAHAGDDIGLKALSRPKVGGSVYKVI
ncbi:MAG: hypothetical protein WCX95_05145 [Candidatus Gracilibacteria bacterium]